MPIVENTFHCPKGHEFTANAKLRARCPTCGSMVRRAFTEEPKEPVAKTEPKTEPVKEEPPKPRNIKSPRLIKQGRPREAKLPKRTPSLADTIREAKANAMAAKKPTVRAKASQRTAVSGGLVAKKRVSRGAVPTKVRPPKKSSVSKVVEAHGGGEEPYWRKVSARYGIKMGRR